MQDSIHSVMNTIDLIEKYQKICMEKYGTHFIQASDEWYILAGREVPEEERYDGYQNNLATIDYDKCTGCGHCAEVCPRHIIHPQKIYVQEN